MIKDGPEDYEVAAGQTATFRCNAVADSSLNLTIDWLHEGELIDFDQEPRFVQSQDSSLTITKTTELDTGTLHFHSIFTIFILYLLIY